MTNRQRFLETIQARAVMCVDARRFLSDAEYRELQALRALSGQQLDSDTMQPVPVN